MIRSCSALLFIFIICITPKTASSCTIAFNPDTNIVKYDLNDPRNPDCPCHAAQKLADEEYKKSLEQHQENNPVDQNNNDLDKNNSNGNSNTVSGSTGSQKHYNYRTKQLKKLAKWSKRLKKKMGKKSNGTKKWNHRLASCFHF